MAKYKRSGRLRFFEKTRGFTGLLSSQGEKGINLYFIMVPLRQKVLKSGTPKPSLAHVGSGIVASVCAVGLHFNNLGIGIEAFGQGWGVKWG